MVVDRQGLDRPGSERQGLFSMGRELLLVGIAVVGEHAELGIELGEPLRRAALHGGRGQVWAGLRVVGG
jgi:hypothetical protein